MMTELLEIDLDSKYILLVKKSLTEEELEGIKEAWKLFVAFSVPALFIIDGEEYELVRKEEA